MSAYRAGIFVNNFNEDRWGVTCTVDSLVTQISIDIIDVIGHQFDIASLNSTFSVCVSYLSIRFKSFESLDCQTQQWTLVTTNSFRAEMTF